MSEAVGETEPLAQVLEGDPVARVAVIGAAGLTGALAARLVWRHPRLELVAATARADAGRRLDELYPKHAVPLELTRFEPEGGGVDAAIVALPHGAAAPVVAQLREEDIRVVDLSADFRLDQASYELAYAPHPAPDLIPEAVYGLPELNRERIAGAGLVANPGCYPTASLLALAPLAEAGLCSGVVIDAKSGVSGAGKNAIDFAEMSENFKPYGLGGHRHQPEIEQELSSLGAAGGVTFIPHLLPIDQGLLAGCYVTLTSSLGAASLRSLYEDRYGHEPFVAVTDAPPAVRDVRDTNRARIHVAVDERAGIALVFCAIDNLWKGASGQALQNLNLMLGLAETEGLA